MKRWRTSGMVNTTRTETIKAIGDRSKMGFSHDSGFEAIVLL